MAKMDPIIAFCLGSAWTCIVIAGIAFVIQAAN